MILNRLGKAIRQQDWFTVLLEIVIVVIGIFVGLRVDDWNEDRKHRAQDAVYLERLGDDLVTMRTQLQARMDDRQQRRDRMVRAVRALERCEDNPETRADLKVALDQYQVSPGINILDATYNEMVASGALVRLDNAALKTRIASTFSELNRLNESIAGIRISIPVVDAITWRHVTYTMDDRDRFSAIVDIPALCDNVEMRNAIIEMVDIQADGGGFTGNTLKEVEALLPLLPGVATD